MVSLFGWCFQDTAAQADQLVTSGIIAQTDLTPTVCTELVGLPPAIMTSIASEASKLFYTFYEALNLLILLNYFLLTLNWKMIAGKKQKL